MGTFAFTKLNWKAPVRQENGGGQLVWEVSNYPDTGPGLPQAIILSLGTSPIRAAKLVLLLCRTSKTVKNKVDKLTFAAGMV